jgi:hypothetical protein
MQVPRFWHCEWVKVPSKFDSQVSWRIPRWGWSGESLEAAKQVAIERVMATKQGWSLGTAEKVGRWYPDNSYFVQPPREEILQELVDASGEVEGWISRNRYGVLVLNTDRLVIIDIDRKTVNAFKSFVRKNVLGWLGQAQESEEEKLLGLCREIKDDSFRLYRTFAGWRVLLVSRSVRGVDDNSLKLLQRFPVDPLYVRLCQQQRCFRARLTAKPWRISVERPPCKFPRSEAMEEEFRLWEGEYNQVAIGFRVCERIYGDEEPCEQLKKLVALHDQLCQVSSALPLA